MFKSEDCGILQLNTKHLQKALYTEIFCGQRGRLPNRVECGSIVAQLWLNCVANGVES